MGRSELEPPRLVQQELVEAGAEVLVAYEAGHHGIEVVLEEGLRSNLEGTRSDSALRNRQDVVEEGIVEDRLVDNQGVLGLDMQHVEDSPDSQA